jgi:hypothetical protein
VSKSAKALLVIGAIMGMVGVYETVTGLTRGAVLPITRFNGTLPREGYVRICGWRQGPSILSTTTSRRIGEIGSRVYTPLSPEAGIPVRVILRTKERITPGTDCFEGILTASVPSNVANFLRIESGLRIDDDAQELHVGETPGDEIGTGAIGLVGGAAFGLLGWVLLRRHKSRAQAGSGTA